MYSIGTGTVPGTYGTIVMYRTDKVSKLPYVRYCMKKYDTGTYCSLLYENKHGTVVFKFVESNVIIMLCSTI